MNNKIKKVVNYLKKREKIVQIFLLVVIFFATSWSFFIPGLGMGHDLNHQARIYEMAIGLREGNFPVIWSQNLAFGYGMPLFEFYAPLPYFVGALFYILGFNLTLSVKFLYLLINILTVISTYYLGIQLFKDRWAAILISATINLAPYRAVDMNIRTALSELWAITLVVMVMIGIIKICEKQRSGFIFMSISFASLILTHNLTALMSLPFLVLFALFYIFINSRRFKNQRLESLLTLLGSGLLGLGLSAFYFLPALIEKGFTQIDKYTLDSYYHYSQHFLYIRQFFQPWGKWEFGGSGWGPDDEMSFFLGFGQLATIVVAIIILILKLKRQKNREYYLAQCVYFSLLTLSLLLTLLKSQRVWGLFEFAKYFQFPWRFLAISLVFIGLIGGGAYRMIGNKLKPWFFTIVFVLLISINWFYFQNENHSTFGDKYNNYAEEVLRVRSMNLYDYLPKDINFFEKIAFDIRKIPMYEKIEVPAEFLFNKKTLSSLKPKVKLNTTTRKHFEININEPEEISLNLAYYPGWKVSVNELEFRDAEKNENGLIKLNLAAGKNDVRIELRDTVVRFWSKVISLFSIAILFVFIVFHRYKKQAYR